MGFGFQRNRWRRGRGRARKRAGPSPRGAAGSDEEESTPHFTGWDQWTVNPGDRERGHATCGAPLPQGAIAVPHGAAGAGTTVQGVASEGGVVVGGRREPGGPNATSSPSLCTARGGHKVTSHERSVG